MKRATVMMKTKTRELDVKHKEYNELLFEINEVNDEMQRNKVKYQQEKNITTKKLRDLQLVNAVQISINNNIYIIYNICRGYK